CGLRNGGCHGCLPSRSRQDNLGRHAPADRVVVGKPGDEVANSAPPEQLDLAADLFAAEPDVALADHADVAQQSIVELGQRGARPGPGRPSRAGAARLAGVTNGAGCRAAGTARMSNRTWSECRPPSALGMVAAQPNAAPLYRQPFDRRLGGGKGSLGPPLQSQ